MNIANQLFTSMWSPCLLQRHASMLIDSDIFVGNYLNFLILEFNFKICLNVFFYFNSIKCLISEECYDNLGTQSKK